MDIVTVKEKALPPSNSNELFFNSILQIKQFYDIIQNKSLKFNITITEEIIFNNPKSVIEIKKNDTTSKKYKFYPIGICKPHESLFHFQWFNGINEIQYEHIQLFEDGNLYNCINKDVLDYLFTESVLLTDKNKNSIPYLLSIINPKFNVIEFKEPGTNISLYAFINLKIKNNLKKHYFDLLKKLNFY
jgi:hypothetical protein